MYKNKTSISLIVLLLAGNLFCIAQEDTTISIIELPPLGTLLDSAYQNSPLIKSQEHYLDQKKLLTSIEKKAWLNAISINANYTRGTNNAQIDGNLIPTYTTTVTNLFGAGFSLKLSLETILNRKNYISVIKSQYAMEEARLEEIKIVLKKMIIDLYTKVQVNKKRIEILNSADIISEMSYSYAELQFKNNTIDLAVFSKVQEQNVRTKLLYEESKQQYLKSLMDLETTVGIKLR